MPSPRDSSAVARVAAFAGCLREHGFAVGPAEQACMLQAAQWLGAGDPDAVRAAWRAIACSDRRDWKQWQDIFDRYWWPQRLRGQVRVSQQTRRSRDLRQLVGDMHQAMQQQSGGAPPSAGATTATADTAADTAADGAQPGAPRAQGGASRAEALHERSGQMWLPQDLLALQRAARDIVQQLRPRPTRRWRSARPAGGARLDLRSTLRRSVAWGGEPLRPAWKLRRVEPPRLFLLVDVSRSMEAHGAFFLRVARAFTNACGARCYVFHLRLADVSPLMKRDSAAAQEKINAVTAGFGAGTRIGACLQEFARGDARHQLGRSARVWVFSDGFDTDSPQLLGQALRELRGRGAQIGWFHPTRAVPAAAAVQQARGSVQSFVPLASLADLLAARRRLR